MKLLKLALITILVVPSLAFALSLDEAKSQGKLGETPSGYLEVVDGQSNPAVEALKNDINSKRRAKYQSIAKKNGTSLSAVETLAGKKAMKKTPAGQFVKTAAGTWKRK